MNTEQAKYEVDLKRERELRQLRADNSILKMSILALSGKSILKLPEPKPKNYEGS